MTTFFRLLHTDDKDAALRQELAAPGSLTFQVEPAKFAMVPGSPFAYWVSDRIRRLFQELPPFESEGRTVKQGLATADDFRFVRCWWEVENTKILDGHKGPNWREDLKAFQSWCKQRTFEGKRWVPFAKGGEYSPFYADLHLVVNWERDGEEMKEHVCNCYPYLNGKWGFVVKNTDYYFRPGLTWPLRSQVGLTLRCNPAGGVFGHKGPVGNPIPKMESGYLAIMNSEPFRLCVGLQMAFGSYEVGVIQRTPVPNHLDPKLGTLSLQAVDIQRTPEQTNEISHLFVHPLILLMPEAERLAKLAAVQAEIDELAFAAYGLSAEDRAAMTATQPTSAEELIENEDEEPSLTLPARQSLESYAVGGVFGRWDIRFATGERPAPPLPDPFDPLPVCSPGMLQREDGLPLGESPLGYPIEVQWSGILVDDPEHSDDIVRRVDGVLERISTHCPLPTDYCSRDYFRKPGKAGFWDDHISRYSKSRRKAPIYWLLQSNPRRKTTPSGSTTTGSTKTCCSRHW